MTTISYPETRFPSLERIKGVTLKLATIVGAVAVINTFIDKVLPAGGDSLQFVANSALGIGLALYGAVRFIGDGEPSTLHRPEMVDSPQFTNSGSSDNIMRVISSQEA